ncbi:TatD family hydrolase [Candidatus Dojkabacteria bacterium]|nr:TatD family hydrolase [Candidatus Dojkabacteria bacterium]
MTDSHTHLTFPDLKINLNQVLNEFREKGGKHLLNVGHNPESNQEVLTIYHNISEQYQGVVQNALGIHPEYITEIISSDLDRYKQIMKVIKNYEELVSGNLDIVNAIGECGLDYYYLKQDSSLKIEDIQTIMEQQKTLFKAHIEVAIKHNLPMTIHTRDMRDDNQCIEDTLSLISNIGKGKARGSFHSYTQDIKYVKDILGLGFYIGVNGIVTYPKADNVREIVKSIPIEKLLLETDAPLLPPQKIRKDKKYWRNYGAPSDIYEIAQMVAEVKDMNVEKVLEVTTENYKQLFLID